MNPDDNSSRIYSDSGLPSTPEGVVITPSGDALSQMEPFLKVRRFGFTIGMFHLLVPEGTYCELLVDFQISPMPNAPDYFSGLLNVRGNIVPLYSLSKFIDHDKKKSKYAYLIGSPENGAAIFIDKKPTLIDLTDMPKHELQPDSLPDIFEDCIDSSYKLGKMQWFSLDHEALFTKLAMPTL